MKFFDAIAENFLKIVMASSSLILFIVTFAQVIFRFLFKYPLPWSQDVIRICFVYLVFFGAAYCVKEEAHLNVDVLLTMMKPRIKIAVELIINMTTLCFFLFIIYYGFEFVKTGQNQFAPYLPIPMSLYYLSVPISGIFMFYYIVKQMFTQIKNLMNDDLEGGGKL